MEKTFQLEIMTPEKQFFKGQAEGLIMPALDGEYGVQPGHEPIVTALEPGTVRYCVKGQWDDVIVGQGFAEVMPDYAILLVSTAERPGEIDKARAERAKAHAEECLRQKQSVQEYHRSKRPWPGNGTAESGGQITGLGFEKKRGVSSWERNTAFLYTLLDQKGSHGKGMGKTCGNRDRLGGNRVEHRRCCP